MINHSWMMCFLSSRLPCGDSRLKRRSWAFGVRVLSPRLGWWWRMNLEPIVFSPLKDEARHLPVDPLLLQPQVRHDVTWCPVSRLIIFNWINYSVTPKLYDFNLVKVKTNQHKRPILENQARTQSSEHINISPLFVYWDLNLVKCSGGASTKAVLSSQITGCVNLLIARKE